MPDRKKKNQKEEDQLEKEQQEAEAAEETAAEGPEEAEETAGDAGAEEASETEKLQEQIDSLNDKLLRTLAEYDNYRKRTMKEKDSIYPQAKADTVEKFLPIIDNFERAVQCECTDSEFKKGIEMIFNSFLQAMKELSVEEIGTEGEPFNPDVHNAVMHVEDEAYGENVVAQVLQKGYKIGDRVVRYAMVKVAN